jgi:hypothetical protein
MYFLKNRFIETGSTGSLPVPVPFQVGPSTGSGTSIWNTPGLELVRETLIVANWIKMKDY